MAGIRRRTAVRVVLVVTLAILVDPLGAVQANSRPAGDEQAAGDAVAHAEARLAELTVMVDEARVRGAQAVEAHNAAQVELAEARESEAEALAHSMASRGKRDEADVQLGRLAAAAYRSGAGWAQLSVAVNIAADASIVDVTDAITAVARSQAEVKSRWVHATAVAEAAAEAAERLVAERAAAEQAAERALVQARQTLDANEQAMAEAAATREALVADLAEARGTTVQLELQRQDGLALQAQRDREQAERAAERERQAEEAGQPSRASAPDAGPTAEPVPDEPVPDEPVPDEPVPDEPAPDQPAPDERPAEDSSTGPAVDPPEPPAAPSLVAAAAAERAISYAHAQLGKPYLWAGAGLGGFDCSGLTMRAWEQGGVQLTHWSVAQARQTLRISYSDLEPGDLIFWSENGAASGTYHVALYIGGGKMIHAPSPGRQVEIQDVFYWRAPSFYTRVTT
jgi:cell wall-associated NlpC family hydrolase